MNKGRRKEDIDQKEFTDETEFLKEKIEPFLEPMIMELTLKKPNDPYSFILKWLDKNGDKIKQD